jgi:integrase
MLRRVAKQAPDPILDEAAEWRAWLEKTGDGGPDDQGPTLLTDRAAEIEKTHNLAQAQLFVRAAEGRAVIISEQADRWLSWRKFPPRGEYHARQNLALLQQHFKEVGQVTRKTAAAFIRDVLEPGRKAATVDRMMSTYRGLWRWLIKIEELVKRDNPWLDQGASPGARKATEGATEVDRRGFTEKEASAFLVAIGTAPRHVRIRHLVQVDLDVVKLLAVTGLRIEEACALTVADITDTPDPKRVGKMDLEDPSSATWVLVRDGKSKAARRQVAVVDTEVRAMLARRVAQGRQWLFEELPANRWGDRSPALGLRIGRMLRATGITDPNAVPAHSWRHRARTLAEAAGCEPWTCDWYFGWTRPGEGNKTYSKPSTRQLVEISKATKLPR